MLLTKSVSALHTVVFNNQVNLISRSKEIALLTTLRFRSFSVGTRAFRLNAIMLAVLFFGFFLTTATGLIDLPALKELIRFSSITLAFVSISLARAVNKKILLFLFLSLIVLTLNLNPIAVNVVVLFLIFLSTSRLSDKEFALALFVPSLLLTLLHISLLRTGFLSESAYEVGDRVRSTLGFANANQLSVFYISLTFTSCYVLSTFRNWKAFFLFVLSISISFRITQLADSRTGMATVSALPVAILFWYALGRISVLRKFLYPLAALSPLIATAASFFLAFSSDPALNYLLSLRPYLFGLFLDNLDLHQILFGWRNDQSVTVDNSYLLLFSAIGGVLFIFTILFCSSLLLKVRFDLLPIAFLLIFSGIFESYLIRPEIPASILLLRLLLSSSVNKKMRFSSYQRSRGLK